MFNAVLANHEILLAFTVRQNNWTKRQKLQVKNKEDSQKLKLIQLQQPTALAIKEQVLVEVDELPSVVAVEYILKKKLPKIKARIKKEIKGLHK